MSTEEQSSLVQETLLHPSTFVFPEQATTVTIEFCDRVCPSPLLLLFKV